VTWLDGPERFVTAGAGNSFQISLFANGSFRLSYRTVRNVNFDAIAGFSSGGFGGAPPPSILASAPFSTGPRGVPAPLRAAPGSTPRIGTATTLQLDGIAPGSTLAVLAFGFGRLPGTALTGLGMPDCVLHVTLDASRLMPVQNPQLTFGLPADQALVGIAFFAQAAVLTPGINPAGVATSNGLALRVGI
jgi:hypothetical protein